MGREIFALLCPDWRGPSFILEGGQGAIAYANWPGLKLLERGGPIKNGGWFGIEPVEANRRFLVKLERVLAREVDCAVAVLRDEVAGQWLSLRISAPRGVGLDVLQGQLAGEADARNLALLDIVVSGAGIDIAAMSALAETMGLAPAEQQLVIALANGQSAGEIAASRGSSLSTVRQRIKVVLSKANCRRQAEVIALARALCEGSPA